MIKIKTFGFKHCNPQGFAGAVVDCRELNNPHKWKALQKLTGLDEQVQDFVKNDPNFETLLKRAQFAAMYSGGGDGACWIGCYGGRHRSVAVAELLAQKLRKMDCTVEVEHLQI